MKTNRILLVALLLVAVVFSSCGKAIDVWADAAYKEDTTLGEGATSLTVEVTAEDKTVTFTVNTDETTVGEALLELGLIDGEVGAYGLYVKTVNGMLADYDIDGSYWAFYINGEYAMTGVDITEITEGVIYSLEKEG